MYSPRILVRGRYGGNQVCDFLMYNYFAIYFWKRFDDENQLLQRSPEIVEKRW